MANFIRKLQILNVRMNENTKESTPLVQRNCHEIVLVEVHTTPRHTQLSIEVHRKGFRKKRPSYSTLNLVFFAIWIRLAVLFLFGSFLTFLTLGLTPRMRMSNIRFKYLRLVFLLRFVARFLLVCGHRVLSSASKNKPDIAQTHARWPICTRQKVHDQPAS